MKNLYFIGRDENCDIVLWNDVVSRQHAQIRIDEKGHYWLMDLGSTNGTTLNGSLIEPMVEYDVTRKDSICFAQSDILDWTRIEKPRRKWPWVVAVCVLVIGVIAELAYLFWPVSSQPEVPFFPGTYFEPDTVATDTVKVWEESDEIKAVPAQPKKDNTPARPAEPQVKKKAKEGTSTDKGTGNFGGRTKNGILQPRRKTTPAEPKKVKPNDQKTSTNKTSTNKTESTDKSKTDNSSETKNEEVIDAII